MGVSTPESDRERIVGELRTLSPLPLTSTDIADELDLKPNRARKLLLELQRAGRVAEKGTAKPTQAKLYYIPGGGQHEVWSKKHRRGHRWFRKS